MIDDDLQGDDGAEPGTIGVGMGGSCPVCRAPVDLGQEFCLECGSPIRFTPRQRRPQRRARAAAGAPAVAPKKSGFPWIPFLVVLALVGAGIAFALVEGGKEATSGKDTNGTEPALPTITNSTPETTASTETTTLQDCDPNQALGGTEPAIIDDSSPSDPGSDPSISDPSTSGEEIPSLSPDGSTPDDPSGGFGEDIPSIEPPEEPGSESDSDTTVTVDQNGNLCPSQDGSTGSTPPDGSTDPGSTTPGTDTSGATTPTTPTGATASGDWPSGKEGWTVIVAGYPTEERATQRSADVQEDGFEDSGVLLSTNFQSLCPGIHVVFSGVFDTEDQAEGRLNELAAKPDYAGMYVREIKTSGSRPTGCTQVQTRN